MSLGIGLGMNFQRSGGGTPPSIYASPFFSVPALSGFASNGNIGITGDVDCSVFVFFKLSSLATFGSPTILSMGDGSGVGTGAVLKVVAADYLYLTVPGRGNIPMQASGSCVNLWRSVAFRKVLGASGFYTVFLDGLPVNGGNTGVSSFVNAPLRLGIDYSGANRFYGNLAMGGIWQTALTDPQILALHNSFTLPGGTPKGIYLLNEGSGTTGLDSSGLGNNGTLTNTVWQPGVYPF